MDGDLLDESFATCLTSSKAIWQVYLGLRFEAELWADYNLADNMRIGAAFWQKKDEMKPEEDRATWTINFNLMTQVNDATGTSNHISANHGGFREGDHGRVRCACLLKSISTLKAQTRARGTMQ